MTYQEAIYKRIYELCKKYNHTPYCLAEVSNIPLPTLKNITECKIKNHSSYIMFQSCITLKIPIKDYFDSSLFNIRSIKN